jgi:5S rRNA maturation endonuclease (ribonuclease M5)
LKVYYIPILWRSSNEEPFGRKRPTVGQVIPFASKIESITDKVHSLIDSYKKSISKYEIEHREYVSNEWIEENDPIRKLNRFMAEKRRQYPKLAIEISFKECDIYEVRHGNPILEIVKQGKTILPSELSSGEKIILYLLLSMCLADFGELSLLLLDELDAHLNPALLRLYFDILTEISKKTQVIITTHSPILANLTPESSLFWMEDGRIIKKHKQSIINILADGLFTANDIQGIFRIFQKDYNIPNLVILCEGIDDELTLREWFSDDTKVAIIDCKCADNMPMFVKLPYAANHAKKPTILCLLDNDAKGQKVAKIIEDMKGKNDVCSNLVETIFVSLITGERIEEVLKDSNKVAKLKERIKICLLGKV